MRAHDCRDEGGHGDLHFRGVDDEDLIRQVREHLKDAHPDRDPDDAEAIVRQGAYDE
jgi:hypothetical protein